MKNQFSKLAIWYAFFASVVFLAILVTCACFMYCALVAKLWGLLFIFSFMFALAGVSCMDIVGGFIDDARKYDEIFENDDDK